jgi:hypothetical protein
MRVKTTVKAVSLSYNHNQTKNPPGVSGWRPHNSVDKVKTRSRVTRA